MSNWLYCRIGDLIGWWPALRRAFDRLWFRNRPPPDHEEFVALRRRGFAALRKKMAARVRQRHAIERLKP